MSEINQMILNYDIIIYVNNISEGDLSYEKNF